MLRGVSIRYNFLQNTHIFNKQRFFQLNFFTFSWIKLQILFRCCLLHKITVILRYSLYLVYLYPSSIYAVSMSSISYFQPRFYYNYRSSHPRCSIIKRVLRNLTKFTGTQLCQCLFFNRVADLRPIINHIVLLNSDSHLPNKVFYSLQWKPFKNDFKKMLFISPQKLFLFSFVLFSFSICFHFSWFFGHVEKMVWLERQG